MLYRQSTTACLTGIVIAQVANALACRSETLPASLHGFLRNRLLVAGIALELALIAAINYTRWGNNLLATAPIPWMAWIVPAPFALALIGFDRFRKRRARPPVPLLTTLERRPTFRRV